MGLYRCGQCDKEVELTMSDPIRCPFCGFKILFKTRQKVVKRVKAR